MFDVITFGSASWDIFIRDKDINLSNKNKINIDLGSKIDVDMMEFFSGGGGTNSAVTFANQGLKTAYCGIVGNDLAGQGIIDELTTRGVDTSFVSQTDLKKTNHSFVLSIPDKDRTIFVYKGASTLFSFKNIIEKKIRSKWFYIAPLSGNSAKSIDKLISYANKNNIKIALNPGNFQLSLKSILVKNLKKIDVLILNEEEASLLSGSIKEEEKIKNINTFFTGIIIITKGSKGVSVFSKNKKYDAKTLKSKIVDKTGAGDSFGSGFISSIISNKNIEESIAFASANATSCIQKWGAKNGLIKITDNYKKIKVNIYES
jgi:sugar/nucleoside kinase (ribokinase family)